MVLTYNCGSRVLEREKTTKHSHINGVRPLFSKRRLFEFNSRTEPTIIKAFKFHGEHTCSIEMMMLILYVNTLSSLN